MRYGVSPMTLRKALSRRERGLIDAAARLGQLRSRTAHRRDRRHLRALPARGGIGGLPTAEVLSAQLRLTAPGGTDALGSASAACAARRHPRRGRGDLARSRAMAPSGPSICRSHSTRPMRTASGSRSPMPRIGSASRPCPNGPRKRCVVRPGTTMGLVERRSFDQYGKPAEASRSWFAAGPRALHRTGALRAPRGGRHICATASSDAA
jgi:hypothetical protein